MTLVFVSTANFALRGLNDASLDCVLEIREATFLNFRRHSVNGASCEHANPEVGRIRSIFPGLRCAR